MFEYWYGYLKPKYGDKIKLCYTDTDSFIFEVKTKDFYEDIAPDVPERFDTSNIYCDRPLKKGINKKVIGKMKDLVAGKIITQIVCICPKTYSYIIEGEDNDIKKAKRTNRSTIKKKLGFNYYFNCLFKNQTRLCDQQRIRSCSHKIFTEMVKKIA